MLSFKEQQAEEFITEEWNSAAIDVAADYFLDEGINEEGIDLIVEEVGLEDFVEYILDPPSEDLMEERSARRATVSAPSYEKVKAKVDSGDAARKKAGKGEYAKTAAAKRNYGDEDNTNYDEKKPAAKKKTVAKAKTAPKPKAKPKVVEIKKKVEKSVPKAKAAQPAKKATKKGLLSKIGDTVKKGVERHQKAVSDTKAAYKKQRAKGKVPEKRAKEFAAGVKSGVKTAVKFAKDVKKTVSEEGADRLKDRRMERGGVDGNVRYDKQPAASNTVGKKKPSGGPSALDIVKKQITDKHGPGAIVSPIRGRGALTKSTKSEGVEGVVDFVKKGVTKGLERDKKAKKEKAIKDRKAVPYAALSAEHQPEGEVIEGASAQQVGFQRIKDKESGGPGVGRVRSDGEIKKEKGGEAFLDKIAKAKVKMRKESVFDQVDIFAEMNDWEISLLSDDLIEEIVAEVFVEEMVEGRDIDNVTDMLCESVDYSLSSLTEVTSPAKVNALRLKDKSSAASSRSDKLAKVKSAAQKVGSALKSGLKTGATLARKGAVKGAEVAGKAAGHAKNLAKDMGSAAKSGYKSTQSSSPDKDSETTSSNPTTSSSDSSSSSSDSGPKKSKKPGLLSRIGSKLKRGIKRAVGVGARSLSRGARNVARRLGEESITERADTWHPDPDKDRKLGGPGANARAREDRADAAKPKADPKKLRSGESYMDYSKRQSSYKKSGSTPTERLNKLGANIKPKERKRDKIGKAIGRAIDKIGGIKREEVSTLSFGAFFKEDLEVSEARNTKADGNSLRSVSTPAMQGKKGNVNRQGRSVTGGASMGGMNIRGAGGLGKSKPKNVELVVGKYKKQVSSDRKAAAKERAAMRAQGLKYEQSTLSFSAFLSEGNPTTRMLTKSKTQVTGNISADRGTDENKNRKGRKGLEKDLKKHGIGHQKGVGEYKYGSGETGREVSYQTSKPDKMSKRRFGKVMRRLGRKHGQESVITKDKDKSAKLHYTEKGSKAKSDSIGKTKAGKHPEGYGETSGTKARGGKLPKKTTKGAYHYG